MLEMSNVNLYYQKQQALKDVSFRLKENAICGLLGRNGAGKTSLLALATSYRRPTSGFVRILGANPYENPNIMSQVAFIYDKNEDNNSQSVKETPLFVRIGTRIMLRSYLKFQ